VVDWTELKSGVAACFRRIVGVGMSAFGRGMASSACGVSRLLHAAEFTGLPRCVAEDIEKMTTALVDRDTTVEPEARRVFAAVRDDLLRAPARVGGFGALPLVQHTNGREAKWAIRLLLDGTSKPWTRLAWTMLAASTSQLSRMSLLVEQVSFADSVLSLRDASLPLQHIPPVLRRLLSAAAQLPPLARRVGDEGGVRYLAPDWVPIPALFWWRLQRAPTYMQWLLSLGAPAWPHSALSGLGTSRQGSSLWDYSVALGTRLFLRTAAEERARRYQRFLAEAGVEDLSLQEVAHLMCVHLTALWRLPVPNSDKEIFWRCFLDGLPTAARLHQPQGCGCGAADPCPGRSHHFGDCPVAVRILEGITQCLPDGPCSNLLALLRGAGVPPGVHQGVWLIVSLAAHSAMDYGRRQLWYRVKELKQVAGEDLAAVVAGEAVQHFWEFIGRASAAPLPSSWQTEVLATHPFLSWNSEARIWVICPAS